jgi:tRNA pseudouridine13 synthase
MNFNPPRTIGTGQLPTVVFKAAPEDFIVDEILGFEPTGEGEHIWILVRKTGCNTRDLVEQIAAATGTPARDIGYSGLKDKHAVTTQWFSIRQSVHDSLSPEVAEIPGIELLRTERSDRKLRTGSHQANRFAIVLRDVTGDQQALQHQLEHIGRRGFPNYFGAQRFGHDGRNVSAARSMFQSRRRKVTRFKRGMYLSAARAWLFNQVLAQRVTDDSWLRVQAGDVCMLDGSRSVFQATQGDDDLQVRHDTHDIHLTGPMVGAGDSLAAAGILELEQRCLQDESILVDGLAQAGLKQERRALRALASDLTVEWLDAQTLKLGFSLARGVFATSLLNEIVDVSNA